MESDEAAVKKLKRHSDTLVGSAYVRPHTRITNSEIGIPVWRRMKIRPGLPDNALGRVYREACTRRLLRDFVRDAAHVQTRKITQTATPHNDRMHIVRAAVLDYSGCRVANFDYRLRILDAMRLGFPLSSVDDGSGNALQYFRLNEGDLAIEDQFLEPLPIINGQLRPSLRRAADHVEAEIKRRINIDANPWRRRRDRRVSGSTRGARVKRPAHYQAFTGRRGRASRKQSCPEFPPDASPTAVGNRAKAGLAQRTDAVHI